MELLVGNPCYRRLWITPTWFQHVEDACESTNVTPSYIFAADLREEETIACLTAHADIYDRSITICPVDDDWTRNEFVRDWGQPHRILHMAHIRNVLLAGVRRQHPKYFLSLDSDILLHPDSIKSMIQLIEEREWDAIGGKCYMGTGKFSPSYAMLNSRGSITRHDLDYPSAVDCIMGIKLMKPKAYNLDYVSHYSGEDIGYALEARKIGLKFGWDGSVTNKHCMNRESLDKIDMRCNF